MEKRLKIDILAEDNKLAIGIGKAAKKYYKKFYDLLPENGMIIINEFLLNSDKTGPVFSALFALNMYSESYEGNAYSKEIVAS